MEIFNKLFKRPVKPIFPIVDIKRLSSEEIEFLIKEFQNRQEDLKWAFEKENKSIPYQNLKFHELITARLIERIVNKEDISRIELEILNGMFQQQEVSGVEFLLITEVMNEENSKEVIRDLKMQGFEFIEEVGFVRIRNQ